MHARIKLGMALLTIFFGVPNSALPAAVQINGICEIGNCTSVDTLQAGGSVSGSINFTYAFANTDSYLVTGNYSAVESAAQVTNIQMDWTTTYLGNSSGTWSQSDVFTLDMLQDYNLSGSLDGYYSENAVGFLSSQLGSGSSFSAQILEDQQSVGVLGPFTTPGYHSASNQQYLSGLTNPLMTDLQFAFEFGQGSQPGSVISTLVPEPAEGLLMMLGGLFAVGLRVARRRV